MIINRSFYREIIQTGFVVTTIFLVLYAVILFVALLSRAASGNLPAQLIFSMLGLQTVKNLGIILPLAFFVGVLLTLGRWYRDSEMTVLAACGIGLSHFVRPVLIVSTAVAAIVGLVAFYFAPLATSVIAKIRSQNVDAYEAGIVPGQFQRSKKDAAIFYVDRIDGDGALHNIFANSAQFGRRGVVVAQSGYHYTDERTGDQFLVLENGKRYDGVPGKADYKILAYDSYALRIEPPAPPVLGATIEEKSTWQIMRSQDPAERIEWQWRLARPLALFMLAPLALVFAYTDARRGRFANLFTAMLFYFLYANLLGFGQALMKQGRVPATVGLWWVHGLVGIVGVYFLWRRINNRPLLPSWQRE